MLLVFTVELPSVMIFKGMVFEVKTHLKVSNIVIHIEVKDTVVQPTEQILFKYSRHHDYIYYLKTEFTRWRDDRFNICMFREGIHALFFCHVEDQTLLYQVLHLQRKFSQELLMQMEWI